MSEPNPIVDQIKDNFHLTQNGRCLRCGNPSFIVHYNPPCDHINMDTGELIENYEGSSDITKIVCNGCGDVAAPKY